MNDGWLVAWLNITILAITAAIIAWYTVETYRLRREAQRQTELQNRPFLSLRCERATRGEGLGLIRILDDFVFVVNLGNGLARNVSVADVVIDGSMELHGRPVTHLACGESIEAPWRVWVRPTPGDPMGEVPSAEADHAGMASRAIAANTVTVALKYTSIVGQRYRTTIRVTNRVAEIQTDERL